MIMIDSKDLARYSNALKTLEKDESKALQKRIRAKAEPIATEVRNAALGLPVGTDLKRQRLGKKKIEAGQRLGLRAGLAAATEVRIRNGKNPGVRIVISRSKFKQQTGKYWSLPRYVEGLASRKRTPWRHPVFAYERIGDTVKTYAHGTWTGAWATQKARPFLLPTVLPHKAEIRDSILKEYQDTFKRTLERHGIKVR